MYTYAIWERASQKLLSYTKCVSQADIQNQWEAFQKSTERRDGQVGFYILLSLCCGCHLLPLSAPCLPLRTALRQLAAGCCNANKHITAFIGITFCLNLWWGAREEKSTTALRWLLKSLFFPALTTGMSKTLWGSVMKGQRPPQQGKTNFSTEIRSQHQPAREAEAESLKHFEVKW